MNKQTEALKMAIVVMQAFDNELPTNSAKEAIQACKKALEQPVQEPTWIVNGTVGTKLRQYTHPAPEPVKSAETSAKEPDFWMQELPVMGASFSKTQSAYHTVPLYRHPPVAQEPVAWINVKDKLPSKTKQVEVVFYSNPYEWWTGVFTPKGYLGIYEDDVFQYHQHWDDDRYHTVDNVTHWMYLPEATKE